MAKENKRITVVHFIEAVNIGGTVTNGISVDKEKAVIEKTATGVTIARPGFNSKWVPDSNIKWIDFSE